MATAYTNLLGFALPVTGELSGTWGDVVNNSITELVEDSIAGTATASVASGDWTLSTTGSGASNEARCAIIIPTGSPGVSRNVIAPSQSKAYIVINQSNASIVFKGAATTGVTITAGDKALVAWNGSDFVRVGASAGGSNTQVQYNNNGNLAGSANLTFDGTTLTAAGIADSSLTATRVTYAGASGNLSDSANLTFDGTTLTSTGFSGPLNGTVGATTPTTGVFTDVTLNAQGDVRFADSDSSNWVAFQGPATIASNVTWTLPNADGTSGQFLSTNGSGTLSWATASGGGGGGGTSTTTTQFTATASQTTFSVTYTAGQISVYLNGALLAAADYTATNGTSVVLATGAAAGDILTVVAYSSVSGLTINSATPFATLVGSGAGAANTGVNNTFVGFEAGNDNTTGTNNAALGYQALDVNTTGYDNVAVGSGALGANTTGYRNTAVGRNALAANTTGVNDAYGFASLFSNTSGSGNAAFGYGAAYSNTTGTNNIAVGYLALYSNTTGGNNTAVGYQSLYSNTTASGNSAFGNYAMLYNTTGYANSAFGASALESNTTGAFNTAVGYQSMDANTTGANNTAVGSGSLGANTTGSNNSAFGYLALSANTTGSNNVALGALALDVNTTGSGNIGIGSGALGANTTANNNTAVGYEALNVNTTGYNNTAVGIWALQNNTTGFYNVAVGGNAGDGVTTGQYNTIVGTEAATSAGSTLTTGSYNTIIGCYSGTSAAGGQKQIVIGYNVAGQADANVTIGSSSGKIYNAYESNATWTQTSDGTMKNIVGPDTLGLSFINRLNPIKFTWKPQNELPKDHPYYAEKNEKDTTTVIHGFVAQEVKAAMDAEGCTTFNGWDEGPDGIQAISREMFISPLVKAIQELSAKCDALQAEINTLKGN